MSSSAANYINFFIDPKARESIDGFFTDQLHRTAPIPAALYDTLVVPDGAQNYYGYKNAEVTQLIERGRAADDPDAARAQGSWPGAEDPDRGAVPWIPIVAPNTLLVMNNGADRGAPARSATCSRPGRTTSGASGRPMWRGSSLRRLAMLVVTLLVSSFVIFGSLYLAPGNPLATLSGGRTLPPEASRCCEQQLPPRRAVPRALLVDWLERRRAARRPRHLDRAARGRVRPDRRADRHDRSRSCSTRRC